MNDKKFLETNIKKSLRKLLKKRHLSGHELSRFNVLASMVSAILIKGRSELRQMAMGTSPDTQHASRVKRFKRWLLNEENDYEKHFMPYASELLEVLSLSGELVFSIDGSQVGKGCMALMFGVIYKGKAIPVIWEVYKAKKGHLSESKHRDLLGRLKELVPENCRVVIVGDGEFDGCDFQADIKESGWDYVLRTGAHIEIEEYEKEVFKLGSVTIERSTELFFEQVLFSQKKYGPVNILIWHGKKHEDPIFLVTNLDFAPQIKRFYKKRFKIEPFFRDQKSKGFHIQRSGLRDPKRLSRLLIATCLAYIISIMAGVKAYHSKFYNKATRTDGEFLSLFQLGLRFIEVLVDLRQWRAFSLNNDFPEHPHEPFEQEICVPFCK